MSDETIGELVEEVQRHGTYTHVDGRGQVWHLTYMGETLLDEPPDGLYAPWGRS
jgi:hypothetical protein